MTMSHDNSFQCSWRWLCAASVVLQYQFGIAAMANEAIRVGMFMQQAEPQESEKLILRGVYFRRGTAEITDESRPVLETVVELLQERPTIWLRIEGHTDWPGSAANNRLLSEQQALAVETYLIRREIEASRLETIGYGANRPLTDDRSNEGRAMNRRIVLKVIEKADK